MARSTPAFTFQMTIPQQTQFKFSPAVKNLKNSSKLIAKTVVQTTHTSPAHHSEKNTATALLPPNMPTKHEKPSHAAMAIPSVQTTGNGLGYESDRSDTAEHDNKFNAHHLVDVTPAKGKHHMAAGRPKKDALDLFLQKCYRESQPGKHLHHCVGVGCNITFSNQNLKRTIKHARICNKLPKNL